jgi:hypothetical protein
MQQAKINNQKLKADHDSFGRSDHSHVVTGA